MVDRTSIDNYLKIVLPGEMIHKGLYTNIMQGIKEVLYRLPEAVFKELSCDFPLFFYIIPSIACNSQYTKEEDESINLRKGFRFVILRSELNLFDIKSITGIISHEVAHAFLHHSLTPDKKENEADELAIKWGFGEEIKVAKANSKIKEMAQQSWRKSTL